jgi:hypothetical protein
MAATVRLFLQMKGRKQLLFMFDKLAKGAEALIGAHFPYGVGKGRTGRALGGD